MTAPSSIISAPPWTERPAWAVSLPGADAPLDATARPLVMGIVNVTPDSFSDGGRYVEFDAAVAHGVAMAREGADILDVGGESTRPGSDPAPADVECERVVPVVAALRERTNVPISVDTQKAAVAEAALGAGATIINDVSALRTDPEMAALVAESGVAVCLMHMQGTPRTMQQKPTYGDVVTDVAAWLEARVEHACAAGIERERILVDPGFGFGKTPGHNLEILKRLGDFHALGCALLVGTSRKSTLGLIVGAGPERRLNASLATAACAVMAGCHVLRVHDPGPTREVVLACEAVRRGREWAP